MKAWRASATSGRCCSAACRLFFQGDGVSLEKARDGATANSDGVPLDQRAADLLQRQVRLVGNQRQHDIAMFPQARAMITAHGPSLNMTLGLQTLCPSDCRADADPEPVRGFSGRRAA